MIVERDVGIPAAGQMLEVREGAGGLEHVVHDHVRCQRLDLVIDGGELVVVGFDQLRGALGDVRIGGEHDRDRLTDIAHLVEREDRLVVKRGAVIGLRDERADILAGDDPVHAGKRPRRAGLDARDAAMRNGAADDLAVQHAGETQAVHVFGPAGDLGPRFQPGNAATDLGHDRDQ